MDINKIKNDILRSEIRSSGDCNKFQRSSYMTKKEKIDDPQREQREREARKYADIMKVRSQALAACRQLQEYRDSKRKL